MKKKITIAIFALILIATLGGCATEAERVSYNLSQEADNFNDIRQVTVINCLQGDVLFQMTGKMSITASCPGSLLSASLSSLPCASAGLSAGVWLPVCG